MKQLLFLFCLLACFSAFAQEVNVTFQVDMTGLEVSADGVHVAGDLNGWTTDATQLTDQGNGIYAVTVPLQSGRDIQFKFINGNAWGAEEIPPLSCAVNGNNRVFTTPLEDMTLTPHPFGGCPADAATKMVTLRVDMTGQTVSENGVSAVGNFQGWSPGSTRMNDTGNGIYEAVVPVLNSVTVLQYKFLNGTEWGTDEDPPADCENFDNNRTAIATGTEDIVLPTQTFAGCENPIPTKDVSFRVDMTGFDVSPDGVHIVGNLQGWNPEGTPMTAIGNDVYEVTIPVPAAISSINYKFVNGNAWGLEEDPPAGCENADNNRFAALPLSTDPIEIPGVRYGSCEGITSLTELLSAEEFQLLPTVSSDVVSVRWQLPRAEVVNLRILDMNGRTISEEKIAANSLQMTRTLEVANWAPGMYFVYLQTRKGHSVRKLMVQ